jgi:hypothetical protein
MMKKACRRIPQIVATVAVLAVTLRCLHGQGTISLWEMEQKRVVAQADAFLTEPPVTVTAFRAERSAGGIHDFFSEGDYWWPDPANRDGPYVQRDGMTNPDNFVLHRKAMVRLSRGVAALAAAYRITGNDKYSTAAVRHLRAWFVDESTRMSPHLKYAQAIKGRVTGRGVGIIDTIHLVEVAKSVEALATSRSMARSELEAITAWFAQYLEWMMIHPYGQEERDAKNNHGTCWVMQVAAFAHLTGNTKAMDFCRERFKTVLVPAQMAPDGSFPLELRRTKPYNYSIFNLDAMAAICQILSSPSDDLWSFSTPDGRGIRKAAEFLYPFLAEKALWPHPPDVMFFEFYPVRQPCLLFAGIALKEAKYLELWKRLDPDPANEEVIRNFPIRQPVLWFEQGTPKPRRR